jgi:hypothetical protein
MGIFFDAFFFWIKRLLKISRKWRNNGYLCYKDEKDHFSDDLLEIAGRGKVEFINSNESEILFSSMYHTLFFLFDTVRI